MNILCPFFRENCHGNGCIMWKNEKCLVVSYLEGVSLDEEDVEEEFEDEQKLGEMNLRKEEAEVPKWLETLTPEEIALEISEFKKKDYPEEKVSFYRIENYFWESKGVDDTDSFPSKIINKIYRANDLAQRIITKEEKNQEKKRMSNEREELPSLVGKCVDWARVNGLKRLALADVDTFILEKNLDLLYETTRAIYTMANAKLKSGK